MRIKNPFKTQAHRKAFDECVRSYDACAGGIRRANGARVMGNSAAVEFWKGYDGIKGAGHYIIAKDRNCLGYVYWCAGQACKKASCPPITYATRCG